jgi:hypothetical protein
MRYSTVYYALKVNKEQPEIRLYIDFGRLGACPERIRGLLFPQKSDKKILLSHYQNDLG